MNILKDKNTYRFYNSLTIEKALKPKEYLFNFDEFGNCWLEDIEAFKLPSKVYDTNIGLREQIKLSFDSYNKNLGILLSGSKGMGKSINAKLLCKEMNLPTIVINKRIPQSVNFVKFLSDIKQNHLLFVDEFEKLFKEKGGNDDKEDSYHRQEVFLSFMDGVITNEHKVLFLLTTNEEVNEYFINRPSRIKFLVEYEELPEELFNLITNDKLKNLEFRNDLEENVSLINLNIDLLISIIDDINLFNKPFSEFKDVYNYKFQNYKYEVNKTINGVERFDCFHQTPKRIKPTDTYIYHHQVHNIVKFNKEEIVFTAIQWDEDKEGKETSVNVTYRLTPMKHFTKEYAF